MKFNKALCKFSNRIQFPVLFRCNAIAFTYDGEEYGIYGHVPRVINIKYAQPLDHLKRFTKMEAKRFIEDIPNEFTVWLHWGSRDAAKFAYELDNLFDISVPEGGL